MRRGPATSVRNLRGLLEILSSRRLEPTQNVYLKTFSNLPTFCNADCAEVVAAATNEAIAPVPPPRGPTADVQWTPSSPSPAAKAAPDARKVCEVLSVWSCWSWVRGRMVASEKTEGRGKGSTCATCSALVHLDGAPAVASA